MADKNQDGGDPVGKGGSVNDELHALVSEGVVRFGDPQELERLYGADFNSLGDLDYSAHNAAEIEVPAFLRKELAYRGYQFLRTTGNQHVYQHSSGYTVTIELEDTKLAWRHESPEVKSQMTGNPVEASVDILLAHLDNFHGR